MTTILSPPTNDPTPTAMPSPQEDTSVRQQIQNIIASCADFLSLSQREITKATKDRRITEWEDVNFHHNAATFTACGVPASSQSTRDHLRKEMPSLIENLRHLENDMGNLNADFKLSSTPTESLHPKARQLEAKVRKLSEQVDAVLMDCKLLKESHAILYGSLNLETILPFAREKAEKKGPIFDIGLKLYQLTADHPVTDEDFKSLDDFFDEANKQEALLNNISLEGIPKLATSVIKEQIKNALRVTSMIKDGIDLLRETFSIEHKHIRDTEKRLAQLKDEDLLRLLASIDEEAQALLKDIMRFHHKAHHMNKIYDIQETLLLLQFLQRTIKKDLQNELREKINDRDSPLNPANAAEKASQRFLEGPKGFWRGSKLLLRLIMQKPALNLVSFENKLKQALNNCPTFYTSDENSVPLENFINENLIVYEAPFPRNDLYVIMKECIIDYGKSVEDFCRFFKVDISSISDKKGSVTIKKLIKKILTNATKILK
ncbi:MAG: hypothetical protein OEL66_01515 [Desulfobulbaceae bacterium]|nr:hypothetical protein [Desulfobulbaceae bacterium]